MPSPSTGSPRSFRASKAMRSPALPRPRTVTREGQLIGLTQNLSYSQLGLDRMIIGPKDILLRKGILEK